MARKTSTPKVDMHQFMTDLAVKSLEGGQAPWSKPWSSDGKPSNFASKHVFTGNNVWILGMTQMVNGYDRSLWLTYRQCKKLNGNVTTGEKSTPIFKPRIIKDKDTGKSKLIGFSTIPMFNVAQCEGLNVPALEAKVIEDVSAEAEAMFAAWPVETSHGGDRAFYRPSADTITLPSRERFKSASEYACTRFHEMAHSTGHKSRNNRKGITDKSQFGNHCYAEEELVAELAASLLCLLTGMDRVDTTDNSKAYLANWATKIKEDPKLISRAVKAAQEAVSVIEKALPAEEAKAA